MEEVKQVIVIRKDLNMRKGKMIAQGAHASMKVIFDMMTTKSSIKRRKGILKYKKTLSYLDSTPLQKWMDGPFTKIVVSCENEEELNELYEQAREKNIPTAMIVDAGKTEFKEPTKTCIAIGPDYSEKIDEITGKLKLL
jgi:PTH2 family peptidyl-tRNA hydrolase